MGARFSRPDSKRRSSSSRSQNASSPSLPQPTPVQMKQLQDGEFVGSLDCGTTSVRFIVFDSSARIVAQHQLEFPQYYPNPGWHEHDADEIQAVSEKCIEEACKQLEENGWTKRSVKAIGITNQRETAVAWDRKTGKPLCKAIVWDDARTKGTVAYFEHKLRIEGLEVSPGEFKKGDEGVDALRDLTGLPLSTYFSAIKLRWMIDNYENVHKAHDEDNLCFGTVESWLVYNLTGGVSMNLHITEPTNASRTLLMDLKTLNWSESLLQFFSLRPSILPRLVSSSEVVGTLASGPLGGVRIAGLIGDQQGALVGNKCLRKGEAKCTYGTGAFLLFNTGRKIVKSDHGLLTTVAYQPGPGKKASYALEGSIAVAGSAINWLRDGMGLIKTSAEVNKLAGKVSSTGGVYFVTAFSGLLAPYWDPGAAGLLIGLTKYTGPAHIARATLEAIGFQTRAVVESMLGDVKGDNDNGRGRGGSTSSESSRSSSMSGSSPGSGPESDDIEFTHLKVDGGVTNGDLCMQILADVGGFSVVRPEMRESTALGSALLAGAAVGMYGWDLERVSTLKAVNGEGVKVFKPGEEGVESQDVEKGVGAENLCEKDEEVERAVKEEADRRRQERWEGWKRAVERSLRWDETSQGI